MLCEEQLVLGILIARRLDTDYIVPTWNTYDTSTAVSQLWLQAEVYIEAIQSDLLDCRCDSGAKNQWNELVTLIIQPQSNSNRAV